PTGQLVQDLVSNMFMLILPSTDGHLVVVALSWVELRALSWSIITTTFLTLMAMLWMLMAAPRRLSRATTLRGSLSHPPLLLRDRSSLPMMLPPRPSAAPTSAANVSLTPWFLLEP
ncbi:hypothetical protein RSAG8_04464, partial [Rhizoctonia solani AG-8 WAC10335]